MMRPTWLICVYVLDAQELLRPSATVVQEWPPPIESGDLKESLFKDADKHDFVAAMELFAAISNGFLFEMGTFDVPLPFLYYCRFSAGDATAIRAGGGVVGAGGAGNYIEEKSKRMVERCLAAAPSLSTAAEEQAGNEAPPAVSPSPNIAETSQEHDTAQVEKAAARLKTIFAEVKDTGAYKSFADRFRHFRYPMLPLRTPRRSIVSSMKARDPCAESVGGISKMENAELLALADLQRQTQKRCPGRSACAPFVLTDHKAFRDGQHQQRTTVEAVTRKLLAELLQSHNAKITEAAAEAMAREHQTATSTTASSSKGAAGAAATVATHVARAPTANEEFSAVSDKILGATRGSPCCQRFLIHRLLAPVSRYLRDTMCTSFFATTDPELLYELSYFSETFISNENMRNMNLMANKSVDFDFSASTTAPREEVRVEDDPPSDFRLLPRGMLAALETRLQPETRIAILGDAFANGVEVDVEDVVSARGPLEDRPSGEEEVVSHDEKTEQAQEDAPELLPDDLQAEIGPHGEWLTDLKSAQPMIFVNGGANHGHWLDVVKAFCRPPFCAQSRSLHAFEIQERLVGKMRRRFKSDPAATCEDKNDHVLGPPRAGSGSRSCMCISNHTTVTIHHAGWGPPSNERDVPRRLRVQQSVVSDEIAHVDLTPGHAAPVKPGLFGDLSIWHDGEEMMDHPSLSINEQGYWTPEYVDISTLEELVEEDVEFRSAGGRRGSRLHQHPVFFLVIDAEFFDVEIVKGMNLQKIRNQQRFPFFQIEYQEDTIFRPITLTTSASSVLGSSGRSSQPNSKKPTTETSTKHVFHTAVEYLAWLESDEVGYSLFVPTLQGYAHTTAAFINQNVHSVEKTGVFLDGGAADPGFVIGGKKWVISNLILAHRRFCNRVLLRYLWGSAMDLARKDAKILSFAKWKHEKLPEQERIKWGVARSTKIVVSDQPWTLPVLPRRYVVAVVRIATVVWGSPEIQWPRPQRLGLQRVTTLTVNQSAADADNTHRGKCHVNEAEQRERGGTRSWSVHCRRFLCSPHVNRSARRSMALHLREKKSDPPGDQID